MTTGTRELRALLAEARARAGAMLASDPVWRALQQRHAEGPAGASAAAPDPGGGGPSSALSRALLESELRSNLYLAVIGKIDQAMALLTDTESSIAAGAQGSGGPGSGAPTGDDLTRIRGLTPASAATLARLGVTTYRQIASWTAADVRVVLAALGAETPIHRQGWIEQAAMLAARAAAAAPPAPATVAPAAAPVAPGQPTTTGGARDAPSLDSIVASALRGIVAAAASATGPAPAAELEPAAPAVLAITSVAAAVSAPPAIAPEPVQAPAPAAPPPSQPDDLELIAGIDTATRRRLNAYGVTRFAEIAAWTAADVVAREVMLLQPLRIRREGWIEQAAVLARGGETLHARRRRAGLFDCVVPAPATTPWVPQPLRQAWPEPEPEPQAVSAPTASSPPPPPPAEPVSTAPADQSLTPEPSPSRAVPVTPAAPIPVIAPDRPALLPFAVDAAPGSRPSDGSGGASTPSASAPPTQPPIAPPLPTMRTAPPPAPSAPPRAVVVPAEVAVPPPPVPVLPQLFAPPPAPSPTIPSASLAAVAAPLPPPPAAPPESESVPDLIGAVADRLESCGSDLPPGMAAALASAAATGFALGDRHPRPAARRPLADSVTALAPAASRVDLRQWRSDTEAELGALSDAAPQPFPPDVPDERPLPPDSSDEPFGDAAPVGPASEAAEEVGDEAEVVIVAREPAPHEPPTPAAVPLPPADELTPAARIKARSRLQPADEDIEAAARGRGLEEASVEIIVRGAEGTSSLGGTTETGRPKPTDKDGEGNKGLSRLVRKALRRDPDDV